MAASNELRLISSVIRSRDIKPVLERGIDISWFADATVARMFKYVTHHYSTYGEVPSAVTVKEALPNCRVLATEDKLDVFLDQLVEDRRRSLFLDGLIAARQKLAENEVDQAIAELQHQLAILTDLGAQQNYDRDLSSFKAINERLDRYEQEPPADGLLGIPTGFTMLNKALLGWQNEQLISVIATAKGGKSTLSLYFAVVAMLAGYKGLFVSFEMSREEQEYRLDGIIGGVDPNTIRRRGLNPGQKEKLYRGMEGLVDRTPFIVTTDISKISTISGIAAKIDKHKPDIVIIDGIYLMRDEVSGEENTTTSLTNISRNAKRLAQRFGIPIIISTQALKGKIGRDGLTADSIGYTSAYFQDSDSIIGLQDVPDQPELKELRILASRNAGRRKTDLLWDWSTASFGQLAPDDEGEPW